MPWPGTTPGRAFAPSVIVFIPRSGGGCNARREQDEWLPRRCPSCRQMTIIGNGRRKRSAHDRRNAYIRVRRGRCKRCGRSVTVLPSRCVPGACYSWTARQQAIERIMQGAAVEDAAPDCRDPNRIADPSTLRRWCWRRIQSLVFALNRVTTMLAWDFVAARRILFPETVRS